MSEKNKDFYVWTITKYINSTHKWWGIDIMSIYDNIKKDFPNATEAIQKMYHKLRKPNFYKSKLLVFEQAEYIYEAIANLIPQYSELQYTITTKEQSQKYKELNMHSWNRFIETSRIDLLMAVLLFTEEFILEPVQSDNVNLTDNHLTVNGNFVTLEVSRKEDKTHVSILVRDVILLKYAILN